MKASTQSPIDIDKQDKLPLICLNRNKNTKKEGFLSRYKLIFIVSLAVIGITVVIFAHLHFKRQIKILKKETNEATSLLEQQNAEIGSLADTIKGLEDEINEFGEKRRKYELLLASSQASTAKLQQDYDKVKDTLNVLNGKIVSYEEENRMLRLAIDRKKKDFFSAIH